jgi:Holliday junction DNA helicase RuvB
MADRLVSPRSKEEEAAFDTSLRPRRLDDYVGQEKVKDNLRIFVGAARKRGEPLDHVLFYGPPGLGKTTLAYILANEMEVQIKVTSGPAIAIPGDLASLLTSVQKGDIIFIDEIHRLSHIVEEALYPTMEDFAWDMVLGKGMGSKSIRLHLPRFTIVGATTRYALLTSPLRDRFGATYRLDFYSEAELTEIVRRSARILDIQVADAAAREIARRGRGTPRIVNRLLKRVRDHAQVHGDGTVGEAAVAEAMGAMEIDDEGLD